jgi:hypothetical protein
MTTWVSNSARYFGASSGVNCSPIIVIKRVCTSGQMRGASKYGSIPGKGERIITSLRSYMDQYADGRGHKDHMILPFVGITEPALQALPVVGVWGIKEGNTRGYGSPYGLDSNV